jgi:hypothetical protein
MGLGRFLLGREGNAAIKNGGDSHPRRIPISVRFDFSAKAGKSALLPTYPP